MDFVTVLAQEFHLRPQQVQAVIDLLDAGNTIPFIARYRKEAHGSLDDQVLREIAERLEYLRGLEKRREEIRKALTEQEQLTDELASRLSAAATLAELEDLYRPFRPKRRTRATVAKEKGLEPLALWLLMQLPRGDALAEAEKYVSAEKGVENAEDALQGARDIIAESVSDDAALRKELRALLRLYIAGNAPAAVSLAVKQLHRVFPPACLGNAQEADALPAVAVFLLFLDHLQNVHPLRACFGAEAQTQRAEFPIRPPQGDHIHRPQQLFHGTFLLAFV